MTSRRIPLVNLSHYTHGTPQERERFVRTWGDGLKEFGFVSVEAHGVDDALIRRTYQDVERLFALPEANKQRYAIPNGFGQRGYTGYGQEHAKNRTVGDLKEFWHVGREQYGQNVWPEEVPSFRQNTSELYAQLERASFVMLHALADYFALPRETFSSMAHEGNSVLRLIHYPPLKDKFIPGGVRAAEHEDINLITLLCEGTASGLEILTRQGDWISVDTLRGQIVVDSGDMLSRVTNDVVPSTTHRVVNPPSIEQDNTRYSMPFFVHPYADCVLDPPACFRGEGHKQPEPPITADAFLKQRLREIGLLK